MTALKQFERLEAIGLWRPAEGAQRREVVMSFGGTSLVLSDLSGRPLSHWDFAALTVNQLNKTSILITPNVDEDENVELSDATMIEAIATVRQSTKIAQKPKRRLRNIVIPFLAIGVLGSGAVFGPPLLRSYAVQLAGPATLAALDDGIVAQIAGKICTAPEANAALKSLADALDTPKVLVTTLNLKRAVALPSGTVVLADHMVKNAQAPEISVGFALQAQVNARAKPPVEGIVENLPLKYVLRLLTKDKIDTETMTAIAPLALQGAKGATDVEKILAEFKVKGWSSTPFGQFISQTDNAEFAQALVSKNPYPAGSPKPVLADGAWLGLQDICTP